MTILPPRAGIAEKILIGIVGTLFVALLSFFVWLATTVIDIRERVVRIETTAKALSDARDREIQNKGNSNAARIERLEAQQQ